MIQPTQKTATDSFEPTVVVKTYRLLLILYPVIIKLPKIYKHTLGQEIINNLITALRQIFIANTMPRPRREAPLIQAVGACETVKILLRLACELGLIVNTPYFQFTADITEINKMLRGWISFVRSGRNPQR